MDRGCRLTFIGFVVSLSLNLVCLGFAVAVIAGQRWPPSKVAVPLALEGLNPVLRDAVRGEILDRRDAFPAQRQELERARAEMIARRRVGMPLRMS
ncbi:hypothetical protein jaqu_26610 [Jannaschia aquimarina]|uniref:Uncharacterized protein n=1 Tax=Jannaschia aquimarina TaxID=935700 RepID=A0A0D1ECV6_9RHOB|nr:hypothetical protein jaqu_26610 [Jannaschia aquimarina]SNT27022.1 hypothetical protein SAMN05421775_109116 [Jannaschia aquimarina]